MNMKSTLNFIGSHSLNAQISVEKELASSDLNDETVILHLKTGSYYGLNEVGTRIWNLIQNPTTFDSILKIILSEYDVEQQQLEIDLQKILQDLYDKGLIIVDYE